MGAIKTVDHAEQRLREQTTQRKPTSAALIHSNYFPDEGDQQNGNLPPVQEINGLSNQGGADLLIGSEFPGKYRTIEHSYAGVIFAVAKFVATLAK